MSTAKTLPTKPASSFRRAVWRGLGVVLPPLLTIVILFWIGNTVKQYGYDPMMAFASGYVELEYLNPYFVVPIFLLVLVLVLYVLGKLLAFGVGSVFWGLFEKGVGRLPLVNSVYSSVKQVTDLLFSEREIPYTRIVALEFPSKGLWSVGFVTSEGLLDVEAAANEPVVNVLVPYAPLPVTGCIVTVRKSETIDLNMTVDQALQFIVSCGVVVPPQQLSRRGKLALAAAGKNGAKLDAAANALVEHAETDSAPSP